MASMWSCRGAGAGRGEAGAGEAERRPEPRARAAPGGLAAAAAAARREGAGPPRGAPEPQRWAGAEGGITVEWSYQYIHLYGDDF